MFCVKPGRGCRAPPTDPHSHFSPRGWALRNRRLTCQGHPDGSVGKKLHDLRKDSLSGRQNAPGCQDANVSCCGNAQDGNAARNQCTPRARRGACRVDRRCEHGRDDVRTSSSKSADMVERMSGLGRAKVRTRVCAGAHASEQTCGLGRDERRGGTRRSRRVETHRRTKKPAGDGGLHLAKVCGAYFSRFFWSAALVRPRSFAALATSGSAAITRSIIARSIWERIGSSPVRSFSKSAS